jgi:sortase (surface protein transpeptidase)
VFFRSLRKLSVVVVMGLAFASPLAATSVEEAAASSTASSDWAPRLVIPRLGLDVQVRSSLDFGPWLYYRDADTVAIAGHRTTHTHPFLRLPELRPGDPIRLGKLRYVVKRHAIVRPTDVWVLRFQGLVLSACHPAGSSTYRYVVFATKAS